MPQDQARQRNGDQMHLFARTVENPLCPGNLETGRKASFCLCGNLRRT